MVRGKSHYRFGLRAGTSTTPFLHESAAGDHSRKHGWTGSGPPAAWGRLRVVFVELTKTLRWSSGDALPRPGQYLDNRWKFRLGATKVTCASQVRAVSFRCVFSRARSSCQILSGVPLISFGLVAYLPAPLSLPRSKRLQTQSRLMRVNLRRGRDHRILRAAAASRHRANRSD